jgi:4-amino-4-deoxy-L-arabinose transferase-like glycosyltransferase
MNIRFEKKILFTILFLGLLVRLGLIMFFDGEHRLFHDGDSGEYLALAENIRLGHGFTWDKLAPFYPNSFRTPVYPGFLFLARFLFGSYEAALVIQSILIVLSAYLLYLIGKEYLSRKIALWSTGIFLFMPFSINVSVKFLTQTLFLSLLILSIWSWTQFLKSQRNKYFLLTSILLPILALTRPIAQYIPFILIFSLAYAVYFEQIKLNPNQFLKLIFIMCAIFAAVLTPWLVRNYNLFGHFKLSSITPYQLYFYDVPDAYALANDISYEEAGNILKAEIDSYSKVSSFQDYMKFETGDILISRSRHYFSAFPSYFFVSRVKNMTKFFLRDGIRYWYNDFSRNSRSDLSIYKIITFKEKNVFPYLVVIERLFLAALFTGLILSVFYFFKENAMTRSILFFFFLLLIYFSFFSGIMASAGFRIVVEPIFILTGLNGLNKLKQKNLNYGK